MKISSIRSSQKAIRTHATVIASVAGGTNTPPTPKIEIVPIATNVLGESGVTTAKAPPKAVIIIVAMSRISRLWFLKYESETLKTKAPMTMLIATGRPFKPT